MKKSLIYPIIATECNDEDGHYFVATSPNIPGMVTQGDTLEDLVFQAEDAIAVMIADEPYPTAQDPRHWPLKANETIIYIPVDMATWHLKNSKTIRKTITMPDYLNRLAKRNGLNVSKIATQAVKQELGLTD